MDINKLLKALDDEKNDVLFNFTKKSICEMNLKILKELHLSKTILITFYNKLKNYKYVDELKDLKYGTFLRWIPIGDPSNIYLTRGAIFCEVKITDNGIMFVCKNNGLRSRYFQIALDKNLIFQKLTKQEEVLLSALEHLSK